MRDGLRLIDIRDPAQPREALKINLDAAEYAPHNLLVHDDLLFVGWYGDGVRVFRYDVGDPERPTVAQVAYQAVRAQPGAQLYDGVWGMRLGNCQVRGQARTCVYASDMQLGLLILALEPRP